MAIPSGVASLYLEFRIFVGIVFHFVNYIAFLKEVSS